MQPSIYLLITISLLAGFFMRPLTMFVVGKVLSLSKNIERRPLVILILIVSILSAIATTISAIYISLKLTGFIPLGENAPTFAVSAFIGSMLWVVYAKKFNRVCDIN